VSLSPTPNHSIFYRKVWESKAAQAKLAQSPHPWVYDNNKLAWYVCPLRNRNMP